MHKCIRQAETFGHIDISVPLNIVEAVPVLLCDRRPCLEFRLHSDGDVVLIYRHSVRSTMHVLTSLLVLAYVVNYYDRQQQ